MSSTTPEPVLKIVVGTFATEAAAQAAKTRLVEDKDATGNMAIVTTDAQGKIEFKETGDMGAGNGALIGGGVGLVLALFAGLALAVAATGLCGTRASTTASSRGSARISRLARPRS